MHKINQRQLIIALLACWLAILACTLPTRSSRIPSPADSLRTPPQVTEVGPGLKNDDSDPDLAIPGTNITLEITEDQLNNQILSAMQAQNITNVQDPRVSLQNGLVEITGTVKQSGFSLPLRIVLTITVDEQGNPGYEIVSSKVGPFPLPQNLLDEFSTRLDMALADRWSSEGDRLFIEVITISDGKITVIGHLRENPE